MKKIALFLLILSVGFVSCDDFLNPEQNLIVPQEGLPNDEREMLAMSLGLYALQQDLVDQIVVLGELRGDLLTVTDRSEPDFRDIDNFTVTTTNEFASPANFYKLIAACNKVIRIIEKRYPEVLDETSTIKNPHKLYGEAVTMRSWAYFYAVRIYNEIPYIPETLNTIDEVVAYVNSPGEVYIDSIYIDYSPNGLGNDTISDTTFVYTEKKFLDQEVMTRQCLKDLDDKVRAVGVDYANKDDINDVTWNVSVWTENSFLALKVQMNMHIFNYEDALQILESHFLRREVVNTSDTYVKYAVDGKFQTTNWRRILGSSDDFEQIFVLPFQKSSSTWQQNNLQYYMSIIPPNIYAMKPTGKSIELWESHWRNYRLSPSPLPLDPTKVYTRYAGQVCDYNRGYGVSYNYMKNGVPMPKSTHLEIMRLRSYGYWGEIDELMRGVDTVAYKYTYGKKPYSKDANFILYRAASLHLYAAEIFTNIEDSRLGPVYLLDAEKYIYNGDYASTLDGRLGVSGRVGFDDFEGISVEADYYLKFDPNTNEVIGYEYFRTPKDRQLYLEDVIMDHRARELAYEGERFYDLLRVARRRNKAGDNGTEWLANTISESFPASDRTTIKNRLMDENNWYIPFVLK